MKMYFLGELSRVKPPVVGKKKGRIVLDTAFGQSILRVQFIFFCEKDPVRQDSAWRWWPVPVRLRTDTVHR